MCGIAGFCLAPGDKFDAKKLSTCLLDQIVQRGEHATGAAWVFTEREKKKAAIAISKAPVSAYKFGPYLDAMPKDTRRAILHTRWATQGSPQNNLNNHPILSGRIVGVHNGHLANDREIFKALSCKRHGEVDSEAAFALLDNTRYQPAEVLESLQGRAALAWFDARDKRDLHLARVTDSPLAIGTTEAGSLIFASTMPLLVAACDDARVELQWAENIRPYTYMRVRNGEILEIQNIGASLKAIA
jgi:glucosamine 6-phosphate synthetase-like amidotransferase/phosphosugar isomerase protein